MGIAPSKIYAMKCKGKLIKMDWNQIHQHQRTGNIAAQNKHWNVIWRRKKEERSEQKKPKRFHAINNFFFFSLCCRMLCVIWLLRSCAIIHVCSNCIFNEAEMSRLKIIIRINNSFYSFLVLRCNWKSKIGEG